MKKKIDWHKQCLIPELLYFQNSNAFTGSVGNEGKKEFRYKLSPAQKTEDEADGAEPQKIIKAEVWYGPFCYEKSTIEDEAEFPMDEKGRSDTIDWLSGKYDSMVPEENS